MNNKSLFLIPRSELDETATQHCETGEELLLTVLLSPMGAKDP